MVSVPVEIWIALVRLAADPPISRLPQVSDPAPTSMVMDRPEPGRSMLTSPDTVKSFVPEKLSSELLSGPSMVRVAQLAPGISTVTVIPSPMTTSSPAVGTDSPPQVVVLLQFPETVAVRVAACSCTPVLMINSPDNRAAHFILLITGRIPFIISYLSY